MYVKCKRKIDIRFYLERRNELIDVMTKLLAGEDNEDDIKRYARLVSLYGVASIVSFT